MRFALAVSVGVVLAMPASEVTAQTHQVKLNGHTFTLPVGFDIELVAGPPLVLRPITVDFDEQGRLYVADSSGSNEKVAVQLEKKPHRIVRLEDTDGDIQFDKSVVFADKMMFPEGTMWHAGSLYVAAPPSIWKLTDTDGDGACDQRVEWFQGKTLTGCANDLHGPYLGPDGWIYWCKGAFAKQTYERPGKKPFHTRASHVFRARPDGSGVEHVMTGGMDNPVDLVFTPGGERIITTTFFQYPAGGKRDGLIHIVYGGIYGKEHDSIYEHPWTGPSIMPVLTHLGPAAPCGLHRYEADVFGPEYKDNIFAALFNLQKITRHVLQPDGATFKCRDEDFLVSDNKDFHPTDVIEDADGSLLVVDTGGWYKLCCPSSQLYKPDVLGAIYRVRKKGVALLEDARGLKLDWAKMAPAELARLLDDPRPAVRKRAVSQLAGYRGGAVLHALTLALTCNSAAMRRNAVWAATRMDLAEARVLVRGALADRDETVRQAALHSVSVWRDHAAVSRVRPFLRDGTPHNRRAAAEALGRIAGDEATVAALLLAAAETSDRVLAHSLIYAVIEIGDALSTASLLLSKNPGVRRAALIALDQMEKGDLPAKAVLAELNAGEPRLREAAWWIASRHAEWGDQLAGILRDRLGSGQLSAAEREEIVQHLARLARSPAIQTLLAQTATAPAKDAPQMALQAMAQSSLRETPLPWFAALAEVVSSKDPELRRAAVATARSLRWPKQRPEVLVKALRQIGEDAKAPAEVRLLALAALPDSLVNPGRELSSFLRLEVRSDRPTATRGLAAEVLSRARLERLPLLDLAQHLRHVGPMEIERVLDPFAHSTDEEVGQKLLEGLKESPARTSVQPAALRSRLVKYPPDIRKQAEELIASLNEDSVKQKARLEDMLTSMPAGDIRRGQTVFNNPKAACISCHAIGYVGGKIGPDLTRIGSIRTERDLLESIVFPGASFVQGYASVAVITHDGKVHNGIVKKESPEEIILTAGVDQEVRIARKDVDEMRPSQVSIMPSGLDQQLSRQDLADLVAFLKACR